ncbi:MAG TPA: hypothetical protein VI815_00895 [Candidatus Nanoarchaeia archaeon]|nr:hypothetical protein [Candidatus Nanoarchaeia archaeon]
MRLFKKINYKDKKGIEIEILGWVLLGLGILVLLVIGIIILSGKGQNTLAYIQDLFRFRR